ncbi:sigma-54-dependent Fis family transcriptional regulator [Azospirillum sp. YIM B02556]|uniref:Sigma-54-dependent Fis family transcriptional regulator n=2 Tax=Azospirillum endophyticum TaxID=2800326 RepID=A0ABS1F7Y8_9PROT|nr:sigma-54 dependent transcriptional regulator [Azospirillum endophyticum]MBK1839521.1 sigma-54-dependent Fis family transcriptional regulator [Azospirillum endophyticum]
MSSAKTRRVLLIEDMAPLAKLYVEFLRAEALEVVQCTRGGEALDAAAASSPDAVILDLKLPDMDGLEVLRALHARDPAVSVVIITAHGSIDLAVEAMRLGAFDFIVKPFNADRLNLTLRNALERRTLARMVEGYRKDLDRGRFHGFIGSSPDMQAVYRTIESVAASRANVFITGESGTGKEVAAQAIHRASPRRDGAFIALNCAAIPKDLLESEIFGHVRGAFTGATGDRPGAALQADGGTLFLDEICEMPFDLQSKLLRFVQTGTVNPVGSGREERVDVRFVAATNRDPLAEVQAGRFREDLYYRLHVIPLALPPLRDRGGDVIEIARSFLVDYAREEGKALTAFSPEVEARLRAHDWPGNVRQLQNVVRHVVVLNDGPQVTLDMLPPMGGPETGAIPRAGGVLPVADTLEEDGAVRPLWQVERDMIRKALRLSGDDVPRAALMLEISPSTIYRKLQQWRAAERGGAGEEAA